ncbi:MAG: uracil-DNA glycosylase [Promethearchaeota archaeon]
MKDESPRKSPCKWFPVCPIKFYTDAGLLDHKWIEKYCLVGNLDCIRYQKEEKGLFHPDNMLPDGSIRPDLS